MDATVTITGSCPGGNHVFVDVTKSGVTKQEIFIKGDLLASDDDFLAADERKAILKEVKRLARASNIKSFTALKAFCNDLPILI